MALCLSPIPPCRPPFVRPQCPSPRRSFLPSYPNRFRKLKCSCSRSWENVGDSSASSEGAFESSTSLDPSSHLCGPPKGTFSELYGLYNIRTDVRTESTDDRTACTGISTTHSGMMEERNASIQSIIDIALPALGAVLSDPLMSLIDTGCVGQYNILQLAALGPNTAIFNFVFQIFTFFGTCTCNLVAKFGSKFTTVEEFEQQHLEASMLLSHVLFLAIVASLAVVLLMESFASQLLLMMGTKKEYYEHAVAYFRIRAFSVPAVLILIVGQGACLGQQDARTPFAINMISALFNLVGDIVLTLWAGWGAVGAAWATLGSQYVGAFLMLKFLNQRPVGRRNAKTRMNTLDRTQSLVHFTSSSLPLTVGWHGPPSLEVLHPFLTMAGPLVLRYALGMMVYTMMSKAAAAAGTLAIAAHQVAIQVFWFLSYIPEALSIAAQSLIARDVQTRPMRVRAIARLLLTLSLKLGLILAFSITVIYLLGKPLLTSDRSVQHLLVAIIPQSLLCGLLYPVIGTIEGIAIGSGDINYLSHMQLLIVMGVFVALAVANKTHLGLRGIWWCLVLIYSMRLAYHLFHIFCNWSTHVLGSTN